MYQINKCIYIYALYTLYIFLYKKLGGGGSDAPGDVPGLRAAPRRARLQGGGARRRARLSRAARPRMMSTVKHEMQDAI